MLTRIGTFKLYELLVIILCYGRLFNTAFFSYLLKSIIHFAVNEKIQRGTLTLFDGHDSCLVFVIEISHLCYHLTFQRGNYRDLLDDYMYTTVRNH